MDYKEALSEVLGELEGKDSLINKICGITPKFFTAKDVEQKLKSDLTAKDESFKELQSELEDLKSSAESSKGKPDPETAKLMKEMKKQIDSLTKENAFTKIEKNKLVIENKLKNLSDANREKVYEKLNSKGLLDDPEKFEFANELVELSLDVYNETSNTMKNEFEKQTRNDAIKNIPDFSSNTNTANTTTSNNKPAPKKWTAEEVLGKKI